MSYIKSGKSFNDIEDVDDDTFLNHPRHGSAGYALSNNSDDNHLTQLQRLQEERRQIENRTLQSTKASLGLIYETEKIGLQTGEELLHQREQLDNVNEKLDSINSIMRVSQKHITSMKSIFGGMKNYFGKKTDPVPSNRTNLSTSKSEDKLGNTIKSLKGDESDATKPEHPWMNRKSLPYDGSASNSTSNQTEMSSVDKQLDENLSEMGLGISRLKDLALGLGSEIESQNKLIDTISSKSERAQDTINNQNRQMKRLLKK